MGKLFARAIAEGCKLPEEDQEAVGAWLLAEIDSERRWDELFARPSEVLETNGGRGAGGACCRSDEAARSGYLVKSEAVWFGSDRTMNMRRFWPTFSDEPPASDRQPCRGSRWRSSRPAPRATRSRSRP